MENIRVEFKSYSELIDNIGIERIEGRHQAIKEAYAEFVKQIECEEKDFFLNERILMHAILDYFTDITRLKKFHDIKLINEDKIISYESSWLIRRKPIQILSNKESHVYVNEKFVLAILVTHLTKGTITTLENHKILDNFCDILLYYLKFRNCDPKILEIMICAFKAGNSLETINYNK